MAKEYTPSEYLKKAKKDASGLMPMAADSYIELLRTDDVNGLTTMLVVPPYIPLKYRARMLQVWSAMVANMIFSQATQKIGYAERFKLAQKIK